MQAQTQSKEKFAKREIDMIEERFDVRGMRLVPRSEPKNVTWDRVVKEHGACLIFIGRKRTILDAFTASGCKAVYDALSDENKVNFIGCDWPKLITIMWKLVK